MNLQNRDFINSQQRVLQLSPALTQQTIVVNGQELTIEKPMGVGVKITAYGSVEDKRTLDCIRNLGLGNESF